MICGIGFTLGYIIYFQFLGGDKADYLLATDETQGISPAGIGCVGMLINFAVSFAVNAFSPAPPLEVQQMVEDIHIPSGSGEAASH